MPAWYFAWWTNWSLWEDDDFDDGRPVERLVLARIRKQAEAAFIIRYAAMYMGDNND